MLRHKALALIHALAQGAEFGESTADMNQRLPVTLCCRGQGFRHFGIVRRGIQNHAHNVAVFLAHAATSRRNQSNNGFGIVQRVHPAKRRLHNRSRGPNVHQRAQQALFAGRNGVDGGPETRVPKQRFRPLSSRNSHVLGDISWDRVRSNVHEPHKRHGRQGIESAFQHAIRVSDRWVTQLYTLNIII